MEPYSMGDLFVEYGFFFRELEERCSKRQIIRLTSK